MYFHLLYFTLKLFSVQCIQSDYPRALGMITPMFIWILYDMAAIRDYFAEVIKQQQQQQQLQQQKRPKIRTGLKSSFRFKQKWETRVWPMIISKNCRKKVNLSQTQPESAPLLPTKRMNNQITGNSNWYKCKKQQAISTPIQLMPRAVTWGQKSFDISVSDVHTCALLPARALAAQ